VSASLAPVYRPIHRPVLAGTLAALATGLVITTSTEVSDAAYRFSLYAVLALGAAWIWIHRRGGDRLLSSLASLGLLGVALVHVPWQLLNLATDLELTSYVEYDSRTFQRSSVLACAGILMLAAGMLAVPRAPLPRPPGVASSPRLYRFGWLVFGGGLLMLGIELVRLGLGRFLSGGYFSAGLIGETSGLYTEGFRFIMWGLLIGLAGTAGREDPRRWRVALVAGTFVLLLMLWGYRGFTGAFAVALYLLWVRRVGPVPVGRLLVGLAVLLFLWQVTNQVRLTPLAERRLSDYVAAAGVGDFGWQRSLTEPGLQIAVVNRVVSHFPWTWDYRYGKDYAIGVAQALPLVTRLFGDRQDWELLPTLLSQNTVPNFLEILIQQGTEKGTGGSQIAEAYANFGPAGVLVVMFLIGVLLARLEHAVNLTADPYRLAFFAMLVQPLLWWIRNHAADIPRAALWGFVLLSICRMLERREASPALPAPRLERA